MEIPIILPNLVLLCFCTDQELLEDIMIDSCFYLTQPMVCELHRNCIFFTVRTDSSSLRKANMFNPHSGTCVTFNLLLNFQVLLILRERLYIKFGSLACYSFVVLFTSCCSLQLLFSVLSNIHVLLFILHVLFVLFSRPLISNSNIDVLH